MADKAHERTDLEIARIQRHLAGIYSKALKDVSEQLKEYALTVKDKADKLYQAIADAETDKDKRAAESAYRLFFATQVKRDKAFKKTAADVSERLYKANTEAAEYINTKAAGVYTINYNQTGKGLEKDLIGYNFKAATEDDVEQYGQLSQQTVNKKKDTDWNKKNVRNAVIAGAVALTAIDKIFGNAAKSTTKKNRNSANRQASDMMTDAESKGNLDSMYRASDEGWELKKQWVCVYDNRTRPSHIVYNDLGPVELDYEYNTGLKRPRDPNCQIADEIHRCRCMLTRYTGHAQGGTRKAREGTVKGLVRDPSSFTGTKTIDIQDMSYKEWMEWRSR